MNVRATSIPEVLVVEPKVFGDARGSSSRAGTSRHSMRAGHASSRTRSALRHRRIEGEARIWSGLPRPRFEDALAASVAWRREHRG
jgi:hypothetical protein